MHPRHASPQIALLACLGLALSVASSSAATHLTFATPTSVQAQPATGNGSSKATVLRVFHALKINLAVRSAGNSSQPVTVLSAVVPRKVTHTRPWEVEIFVYRSSVLAAQAFDAGIGGWRDNGIPATRANNLIVTVVPNGQQIGAYGPAFPMPQLVRDALRALTRPAP